MLHKLIVCLSLCRASLSEMLKRDLSSQLNVRVESRQLNSQLNVGFEILAANFHIIELRKLKHEAGGSRLPQFNVRELA
jgi:hypothetical protein